MNLCEKLLLVIWTGIFLTGTTCFAAGKNTSTALWAIAEIQDAVNTLQQRINGVTKTINTALEGPLSKIGQDDLTDDQLGDIQDIVNDIKGNLFAVPKCVIVRSYDDMKSNDFKKGKEILAREAAAEKK